MKFPGMSPVRARVMSAPLLHFRIQELRRARGASRSTLRDVVLTAIAIVLAIFVLPQPWGIMAIGLGVATDLSETVFFWRWSRRRKARVGIETLVGRAAVAVSRVDPGGRVKLDGELWGARSETTIETGAAVVVRDVEGLTLVVEPYPERARGA
ncbi:MAG: NfeD family protein [Actinobacteria bacterium]|nr:MAG: NfeD family protein [Actinomycetota bacterium]